MMSGKVKLTRKSLSALIVNIYIITYIPCIYFILYQFEQLFALHTRELNLSANIRITSG